MSKTPTTPKARIFLIGTTVAVLALSWLFSYVITSRIQVETARTVDQAIPVQDMGWVRVDVDGMIVRLGGEAPTDDARFRVTEAVTAEINVARLENNITAPEANLEEPELSLEIVQNKNMASIMGLLPKEPSPVPLYHALDRAAPNATTLNLVQSLDSEVDESWQDKIEYLAFVVDTLENAKISATENSLVVETVAPTQEEAEDLRNRLQAKAPKGYDVELDISSPRPLLTPFVFELKSEGESDQIIQCSARDELDLSNIMDAFPDASADNFENCNLGLGAPTDEWGLLVAQLVEETRPLAAHGLYIRDNQVRLDYSDQEDPEVVERVSSRIRGSLPPGFGFDSQKIATIKSLDELEAEGNSVVVTMTKTIEGNLNMTGVLTSEAQEYNIASIAGAKFGTDSFEADFTYAEGVPTGWEKHIFALVNAIDYLQSGEANLTESYASIRGTINSQDNKDEMLASLRRELGDLPVEDNVTVNETISEVEKTTPTECVHRINQILAENPIQFEPSSSRITPASQPTLTAVAQALFECRQHAFEIGGHTDSKGSDELNLRISQDRAEAVLEALEAKALDFGPLIAKGYGEVEPVASNDTEEGRAQNRRIELRAAQLEDSTSEDEPPAEDPENEDSNG